ncbi:MAG: serine hydrolase [Verrucomicrobiota bacterium]|nr:serine hydrolase [Verrucomicrobiota bacterium]
MSHRRFTLALLAVFAGLLLLFVLPGGIGVGLAGEVFPGEHWQRRSPEAVGMARDRLEQLSQLVGGRGCVVRHGWLIYSWGDQNKSSDVASAFKPVLTTLMLIAVQDGKIAGVDSPVADFEPRLRTLNGGKDANITWRHLAMQISGYGLIEKPGAAYAYNDYALALYYNTLMDRVFRQSGDRVLRTYLAGPLQFEDRYTFHAFGKKDRAGRLAVSRRDFARFGLLYLRNGTWRGRQLLKPDLIQLAMHSPLPPRTPLTSGQSAPMLPHQRTIGGGRNITPVGPGYYSFNWWLNGTNRAGERLFADAPPDTCVASGHGGECMLWIIPSMDLIVCWNDSNVKDQDHSPGDPGSRCNRAAGLIVAAVQDGKAK